jgi:hypothetical protein
MALLTQKDIDGIKEALNDLAPFIEEPIVYRRYDHTEAGDPTLGTSDRFIFTDDPSVFSAIVNELTLKEVQVSGGVYLLGDLEFIIRRTAQPAYEDRIVYGGNTWKPVEIKHLWLKEVLWWEIVARKE